MAGCRSYILKGNSIQNHPTHYSAFLQICMGGYEYIHYYINSLTDTRRIIWYITSISELAGLQAVWSMRRATGLICCAGRTFRQGLFSQICFKRKYRAHDKNIGFLDEEVIWLYTFFTDVRTSPVTFTLKELEAAMAEEDYNFSREGKTCRYQFKESGRVLHLLHGR